MDPCLLRQLRRHIKNVDSELKYVANIILSLDSGEEALMEERLKLKRVFLQVIDLMLKHLLKEMEKSLS